MAGEHELTEAELDRYENSLLMTGALFVVLDSAPLITHVEIPDSEPCLIIGFDFLKSKYRLTVEQIVDGDDDET